MLHELNRQARARERIYNTVRPYQRLGDRAPLQLPEELEIVPRGPPPPVSNVLNEYAH